MVKSPPFSLDDNPDKEPHDISIYIIKGVTGAYVGHVKEIPGVIIQADTEEHLDDECTTSLDFLVSEFPEIHDKLWPNHVSAKGLAGLIKQSMQYRKIEVTVPPF
jgi:predicted RNase H-like HicB family nuclease